MSESYLVAVVLGIVEGLTEFLPISSTGHLILAGGLLGYHSEKAKVFEIVIQTGAMMAIVWEYRQRFFGALQGAFSDPLAQRFIRNLIIAFIPAGVMGLLFNSLIKSYLFFAVPVALAFIIGGVIILWVERKPGEGQKARADRVVNVDDMTWQDALKVGIAQTFALIPGTSRSGATIIGGMLFGLSRKVATEFSFFLAVPTLVAAGAYSLIKNRGLLSADDIGFFAVGSLTAFVSAFVCVRWLLRYIATHDFTVFAWYRIIFGLVILATVYTGALSWPAP
jgi:undecaprenyl-diphosphatase